MKILGIDPGTRNCGYAIVEKNGNSVKLIEAGLIKIKTKILQEQIVEMTEGFDLIFDKHVINHVSIAFCIVSKPLPLYDAKIPIFFITFYLFIL